MKNMKKTQFQVKRLVFAAVMTAMSVVIGLVCKAYFTFGAIRITFDNLPVLISGILLGPVYGGAVGAAADLITAPITGSVNPLITLGAASVGIVSGCLSRFVMKRKGFLSVLSAVMPSHVIGSMIIKSLGLWYFYGYAVPLLLPRIPLYFAIGLIETYIIYIVLKNPRLSSAFEGVKKR